jgi:hypothetical protein
MIENMFFCDMIPYGLADGYQHFEEDLQSRILQNVSTCLPDYNSASTQKLEAGGTYQPNYVLSQSVHCNLNI